jgi:DNA-binding MarR family transcriptional regulator
VRVNASDLDPVIHQPNRLQLLGYLQRNRESSFARLRNAFGLTAGNLATHLSRLEEAGFVSSRHALTSRFEVRYAITPQGSEALRAYVARLTALLREHDLLPGAAAGPDSTRSAPDPAGTFKGMVPDGRSP